LYVKGVAELQSWFMRCETHSIVDFYTSSYQKNKFLLR